MVSVVSMVRIVYAVRIVNLITKPNNSNFFCMHYVFDIVCFILHTHLNSKASARLGGVEDWRMRGIKSNCLVQDIEQRKVKIYLINSPLLYAPKHPISPKISYSAWASQGCLTGGKHTPWRGIPPIKACPPPIRKICSPPPPLGMIKVRPLHTVHGLFQNILRNTVIFRGVNDQFTPLCCWLTQT